MRIIRILKNEQMKKLMIIGLGMVAIFSSCANEEMERLKAENAELTKTIEQRDDNVYDLTEGLAAIQGSLRDITMREKLLSGTVTGASELGESPKEQMLRDIVLVDELIKSNQKKIDELQSKMKKSDGKVYEFERVVANLKMDLLAKEQSIADFKERLIAMESSYADLFDEFQAQRMVSTMQDAALHKVWFAYGTKKELQEMNVIEKEGGVLGVGATYQLKDDFNKEYFTEMDDRTLSRIPLQAEKVNMVSKHPAGSYELRMDGKTYTELIITDPNEFWSGSKYLAMLVE